MTVKELITLLNSFKFKDELFIHNDSEEVWQGYTYERQVYKYLEDMEVKSMWIGIDGLCIEIG